MPPTSASCNPRPSRLRYPELARVAARIRAWARTNDMPEWLPGVILAFIHWWILPPLLTYYLFVSEDPLGIGIALTACVLTGTLQAIYDSKCPLIVLERHMLGCPCWWRGLPFSVVATYIQPAVVIGGTTIGLLRFIANLLLTPDDDE